MSGVFRTYGVLNNPSGSSLIIIVVVRTVPAGLAGNGAKYLKRLVQGATNVWGWKGRRPRNGANLPA